MNLSEFCRILLSASFVAVSCGSAQNITSSDKSFPAVDQQGKTAIVAHRGFWNSEQGGMSENSIASLKAAQDAGLWGSECDIHLTADGVIIVNHDNVIDGKVISSHCFADFADDLLPNGERRPSFDEYLDQTSRCKATKLVIELKSQPSDSMNVKLFEETVEALKKHGLYSPDRVAFISFNAHICRLIAVNCPEFTNQFLGGDKTPEHWASEKVNGIDFHYSIFRMNHDFVKRAHKCRMSVNVWTVDKKSVVEEMLGLGVDQITTNDPLLIREILGDKEYRK